MTQSPAARGVCVPGWRPCEGWGLLWPPAGPAWPSRRRAAAASAGASGPCAGVAQWCERCVLWWGKGRLPAVRSRVLWCFSVRAAVPILGLTPCWGVLCFPGPRPRVTRNAFPCGKLWPPARASSGLLSEPSVGGVRGLCWCLWFPVVVRFGPGQGRFHQDGWRVGACTLCRILPCLWGVLGSRLIWGPQGQSA